MKRKILFLTASAGEGHNSMCKALTHFMQEYFQDVDILLYDLYKDGKQTHRKKLANWMLGRGYFYEMKFLSRYGNKKFNQLKNTDFRKKKCRLLRYNFITPVCEDAKNLLEVFKPDSIFSAHTFSGIVLNDLRRTGDKNALKAKIVTIVSDFDVAPYTELLPELDYFITPTSDFEEALVQKGIDKKKIVSLGIPTQSKFSKCIAKQEAKERLKLDVKLPVVLLMSGGLGFGNMEKLVKNLDACKSDFQIVCVCGKNERMKKKLDNLKKHNKTTKKLTILGFSNEIDLLMSAADLLVSKAGGLSTSEAFNKNLPIIITKKLPHQENDNCKYLTNLGATDHITKDKFAYEIVDKLLLDEEKLNAMKDTIKKLQRPNATRDIAQLLYYGQLKK